MSTYTGKSKTKYTLIEPAWTAGGEGKIYKIKDDKTIVAKIFLPEKRTQTLYKKLEVMARASNKPSVDKRTTWPKDLLYEDGKPIGYIMKLVESGEMLCEINGPNYQKMPWKNKLLIAANLSSAVADIHTIGHVIGDMNPRNILINQENLAITLIDTDSYHIIDDVTLDVYRCNVARGEYIAPELMKRMKNGERLDSLALPTFTQETDNFALAVHIFTLLMGGWHPFACGLAKDAPESTVCPKKQDNILTGYSPYFSKNDKLKEPEKAPNLKNLPKELREMFHQAFVDGYADPKKRPCAKDWDILLRDLYGKEVLKEEKNASKEKSKHSIVPYIVGIIVIAVLLLGGTKCYQIVKKNHQMNQLISYIETGELEQANKLLEQTFADTEVPSKVINAAAEKILEIKTEFWENKLAYQAAIQNLNLLEEMLANTNLESQIQEAKAYVEDLNAFNQLCQEAYNNEQNGNYLEAIQLYGQVDETNSHYQEAQQSLQNVLDKYMQQQLEEAAALAKKENWQAAIDLLNDTRTSTAEMNVSQEFLQSHQDNLTTLIESYQENLWQDNIQQVFDEAEIYAEQSDYQNAILTLQAGKKEYAVEIFDEKIEEYQNKQTQQKIANVLESANTYIEKEGYAEAIAYLNIKKSQYETDSKFSAFYEECIENYRSEILIQVKELVTAQDYVSARNMVEEALSLLGSDERLDAVKADLDDNEIIYLKNMKIVDSIGIIFEDNSVIDTIGYVHEASDSLMRFQASDNSNYGGTASNAFVEYYLGGQYDGLSAYLFVPDDFYRGGTISFRIWLSMEDDPNYEEVKYEIETIKRETLEQPIQLDIKGAKWIKIWVGKDDNTNPTGNYNVIVSQAFVYKKSDFPSLEEIEVSK